MARRAFRDPIWRFLLLGALLYGLDMATGPAPSVNPAQTIVLTEAELAQVVGSWTSSVGAPPSDEEIQGAIAAYVREEALLREARRRGLDRGDLIVRRRLIQKMEFLAEDLAVIDEPDEQALATWLVTHREQIARPARVDLIHVFLSRDRRGDAVSEAAQRVLAQLREGRADMARPWALGDPFLLEYQFKARDAKRLEALFGQAFSEEVMGAEVGRWIGPLESSYGLHLVKVTRKEPARLPPLSEVRAEVRQAVLDARRKAAREAFIDEIVAGYRVSLPPGFSADAVAEVSP